MPKPLTPLFPAIEEPIIIQQGAIKDCYLLAALDCILNLGEYGEGRKFLESKFVQTAEGVTLSISRSVSTPPLQHQIMDKYRYYFDAQTNKDIFFISRERLEEIDAENARTVKSNALAIKILEHIVPYYFHYNIDTSFDSIEAHNQPNRYQGHSTEFIASLLGLNALVETDPASIRKFKLRNASYPVYMSMGYRSSRESFARHSVLIDKVFLGVDKQYYFIIINPWDNRKTTILSEDTLKKRRCRFCIFDFNEPISNVQEYSDLKNYFTIHGMGPLWQQLGRMKFLLNAQPLKTINYLKGCIELHKELAGFTHLCNELTKEQRLSWMINCLFYPTTTHRHDFLCKLLYTAPDISLFTTILKIVLHNNLPEVIVDVNNQLLNDVRLQMRHYPRVDSSESRKLGFFGSKEFFQMVIEAAYNEVNKKRGVDIENGILSFYFWDNPRYLPRAGGLRLFFDKLILSKHSIHLLFEERIIKIMAEASIVRMERGNGPLEKERESLLSKRIREAESRINFDRNKYPWGFFAFNQACESSPTSQLLCFGLADK